MNALAFLLAFLASYRIARIATTDSLSHDWRRWLFSWAYETPEVGPPVARSTIRSYVFDLFTCPLCLGVWVSALVYVAWVNWSWSHPPLVVLAIAGAQCWIQSREGE